MSINQNAGNQNTGNETAGNRDAGTLPGSMRAIAISEPGGPEVLKIIETPLPDVQEGDILIRVEAAGVNRPDIFQRLGKYAPPRGASPLPGLEVSGTVAATGGGAQRFSVGDRVCGLANGGGYADYVAIPESQCLPAPRGLSMIEAAALPETTFTVWANMFDRGRLAPGETVLVHGGSSGIGTTAIQMAALHGATVITTVGSDEKCAACVSLGATRAVNYRNEDYVEAVRDMTGGRGVDVVLDMVGGDYIQRNINCMAQDGRHVSIAFLLGPKVSLNMQKVMTNCLTLTGSTLRPRTRSEKARIADNLHRDFWPHIEAGRLKPVVHATFDLADARDAHALMESSSHIGKIVLTLS